MTSFRGLDNPTYYMTDTEQYVQLLNYSGCGNTTNANHPVMQRLIMDSLRMWAHRVEADWHPDALSLIFATCADSVRMYSAIWELLTTGPHNCCSRCS